MTSKITNIPLKDYRRFLKKVGCKHIRTNGGHEIWTRADLLRPITFQSHIDPVPARIIKQALEKLKLTKEQLIEIIS